MSRGMVKRCPQAVAVGHRFDRRRRRCGDDERVGFRRGVILIFAGWLPQDGLFGVSGVAGLDIERAHPLSSLPGDGLAGVLKGFVLIDQTRVRSQRCRHHRRGRSGRVQAPYESVLEHGQRPAPAGQLAGDRGVRDRGLFVPAVEADPAGVQALVRALGTVTGGRTGRILAAAQRHGGPQRRAVMPGGLDQQPAGVAVTGLGDRSLRSGVAGGRLGGHQPEVGADARPVNRCQSPISTANPNAVNVATPRTQHSRRTTGVKLLAAAMAVIVASSRSRRATAASTVS